MVYILFWYIVENVLYFGLTFPFDFICRMEVHEPDNSVSKNDERHTEHGVNSNGFPESTNVSATVSHFSSADSTPPDVNCSTSNNANSMGGHLYNCDYKQGETVPSTLFISTVRIKQECSETSEKECCLDSTQNIHELHTHVESPPPKIKQCSVYMEDFIKVNIRNHLRRWILSAFASEHDPDKLTNEIKNEKSDDENKKRKFSDLDISLSTKDFSPKCCAQKSETGCTTQLLYTMNSQSVSTLIHSLCDGQFLDYLQEVGNGSIDIEQILPSFFEFEVNNTVILVDTASRYVSDTVSPRRRQYGQCRKSSGKSGVGNDVIQSSFARCQSLLRESFRRKRDRDQTNTENLWNSEHKSNDWDIKQNLYKRFQRKSDGVQTNSMSRQNSEDSEDDSDDSDTGMLLTKSLRRKRDNDQINSMSRQNFEESDDESDDSDTRMLLKRSLQRKRDYDQTNAMIRLNSEDISDISDTKMLLKKRILRKRDSEQTSTRIPRNTEDKNDYLGTKVILKGSSMEKKITYKVIQGIDCPVPIKVENKDHYKFVINQTTDTRFDDCVRNMFVLENRRKVDLPQPFSKFFRFRNVGMQTMEGSNGVFRNDHKVDIIWLEEKHKDPSKSSRATTALELLQKATGSIPKVSVKVQCDIESSPVALVDESVMLQFFNNFLTRKDIQHTVSLRQGLILVVREEKRELAKRVVTEQLVFLNKEAKPIIITKDPVLEDYENNYKNKTIKTVNQNIPHSVESESGGLPANSNLSNNALVNTEVAPLPQPYSMIDNSLLKLDPKENSQGTCINSYLPNNKIHSNVREMTSSNNEGTDSSHQINTPQQPLGFISMLNPSLGPCFQSMTSQASFIHNQPAQYTEDSFTMPTCVSLVDPINCGVFEGSNIESLCTDTQNPQCKIEYKEFPMTNIETL